MKKIIAIAAIIAVAAFSFASCVNFEPEKTEERTNITNWTNTSSVSGETPMSDIDNQTPVPDNETLIHDPSISLIIVPGDGWTIGPDEILPFKAYLSVNNEYTDVTNDVKTVFDFNDCCDKCLYGDSLNLINGQEIIIRAMYDKKYSAQSIGKYILPEERADDDDEV